MRITLANQTQGALSIHLRSSDSDKGPHGQSNVAVLPHTSATMAVPALCSSLHIQQGGVAELKEEAEGTFVSNGLTATIPLRLGAKWKSVHISPDAPWRVYRSKVCHNLSVSDWMKLLKYSLKDFQGGL